MGRKIICMLFAVGVLALSAFPASAAGQGVIQVTPQEVGNPVPGGEVSLYAIGKAVEGGYRLSAELADWTVDVTEIFDPDLARWLAENIRAEGISKSIGDAGSVEYSGLEEGVYLMIQTQAAPGYQSFRPYIVVLPMSGQEWKAPTYPKVKRLEGDNPKTGDTGVVQGIVGMAVSGVGLWMCGRKRGA